MKKSSGHPSNAREDRAQMSRSDDLGGVECLSATLTEFEFRPHAHEEFLVALTEAGLGKSTYRGASHVLGPGDVVVLNPEEAHSCGPPSANFWTYEVLYAPTDLMKNVIADFGIGRSALPRFGDVVQDRDVAMRLRRFHRLSRRPGSSLLERESGLAEALMLLVGRHAAPRWSSRSGGQEHRSVRRSKEYLEEHRRT